MEWKICGLDRHARRLLASMLVVTFLSTPALCTAPYGSFDTLTNSVATGWAFDPDRPGLSALVDFYADGPPGQGVLIATATANQPRADLQPPLQNHAFVQQMPPSVLDGNSHAIYAYVRDIGPGPSAQLSNSPKVLVGTNTEIVMGKFNTLLGGATDPWSIGNSDKWEFVKRNIDGILLYIQEVSSASLPDLQNLATVCSQHSIKITVECAGLADWHAADVNRQTGASLSAENSFAQEYAILKRYTDPVAQGGAGGTIDYLHFDGTVRRMLYPFNVQQNYHTVATATDELAELVQLWRGVYPNCRLQDIAHFANWGWKGGPAYSNAGFTPGVAGFGDFFPVLQTMVQKTNAVNIPLYGITIDYPYDYVTKTAHSNQSSVIQNLDMMARLLDLEKEAEALGQKITITINSSLDTAPIAANQVFRDDVLAYLGLLHSKGFTPRRYNFQSWYTFPSSWMPETSGYSETHLAREMILALRDNPDFSGPPVADFTSNVRAGLAPLTVNFSDLSSDLPTSWAWDFQNNGSTDSTVKNPQFTYTPAGTYTVKLTATNAAGSAVETKTGYVIAAAQQQTYTASGGFSSTQGLNQWFYKQWDGQAYSSMTWDAANSRWKGTQPLCQIGSNWQHPDINRSVRTWVSPQNGVIRITGNVRKGNFGGDGIRVMILQNATPIWGPYDIGPNDAVGINFDLTRTASTGDSIYFREDRKYDGTFDTAVWDPTINLHW